MDTTAHDWLDTLARRTVGGAKVGQSPADGVDPPDDALRNETASSEHLSRAQALRLGVAGAVSLLAAGGIVPAAWAQTRDECLDTCFDKHVQAAERATRVCADFFNDPKSVFRAPKGAWSRWRAAIKRGGWNFLGDWVKEAAWEACEQAAVRRMENGMDRCVDACRETCGSRTTSSRGQSRATCHGTPPPRTLPPKVPPAPSTPPSQPPAANDYCGPGGACEQVGGKCCGPPTGIPGVNVCLAKERCP